MSEPGFILAAISYANFPEQIRRGFLADEHLFNPRLAPRFIADSGQSDPRIGNLLLVTALIRPRRRQWRNRRIFERTP